MSDPREVLRRWVDCLNDGDADGIAGLYDPAGVLLPTFSSNVCTTEADKRWYFEKVLVGSGCSVTFDEDSLIVQALGGDCYVLTGLYELKVKTNDKTSSHAARFTVVMDVSRQPPILNHHSSVVPTGLP